MRTFLLVLGTTILAACGGRGAPSEAPRALPPPLHVQVASAQPGEVREELVLTGDLVANRRTIVVTELDGVISSIAKVGGQMVLGADGTWSERAFAVGLGQRVTKDDVLVEIAPKDYQLARDAAQKALETVEAELAILQAWQRPEELRRLEALRDQAAARVELAGLERARAERLREQSVLAQSDVDAARSAHATATAALEAAEAGLAVARNGPTPPELDRARARVAQARAQLALAQDRLDRTRIRAPFDGVITERFVDVGERVTAMPRVEILEIMDVDVVFVEVGIPERHVHQVAVRDVVAVRAEGLREPVRGAVVLVNDKIDRASRTCRVRVAVDNPDRTLRPGQFVHVAFPLRSSRGHVVVSRRALAWEGGQPQVFVLREGRVAVRRVRLGLDDGERVEVLEGLEPGEEVVTDDPGVLADGMRVQVRAEPVR